MKKVLTAIIILIILVLFASFFRRESIPIKHSGRNVDANFLIDRWMAFGDLRGYVEPCGCNPATDLGGLARILNAIQIERSGGELSLVSPGNFLKQSLEPEKIDFMVEFVKAAKIEAVLFNKGEEQFLFNAEVSAGLGKKIKSIPFVRTNQLDDRFLKYTKKFVEYNNAFVYGFSFKPDLDSNMLQQELNEFQKIFAKTEGKKNILLLSATNDQLKIIDDSKLFDLIISANTKPFAIDPSDDEKKSPGILFRGGETYMVPSYGQGLLLGGDLRQLPDSGLDLKSSCVGLECMEQDSEDFSFTNERYFVWLDKNYDNEEVLKDEYARYELARERAFDESKKERLAALADSQFLGAEACQGCHQTAYEKWASTGHANALATLEAKGKSKDPECVSCHVLGLRVDGGFVGIEETPQFANVQCENCHGPRMGHIQNPTNKEVAAIAPDQVCTGCHKPPHTSSFDYAKYWSQIAHGLDTPTMPNK